MLHIEKYLHASTLAEAYTTLETVPGSVVLGGCGYLRLGARKIGTAIDLSALGLDYVQEARGTIEIGAMTTLGTIENHPLTGCLSNGVLAGAVRNIVGVQLRNCVTIGGTVAGRYPFSDPLTALLALDTSLQFVKSGRTTLAEYLAGKGCRDILEKIVIPLDNRLAAFASVRKTATDYAVLNVAVAKGADGFRIVAGSRPGRAVFAEAAAHYLSQQGLDSQTAETAGAMAAAELQFGDNPRGSAGYRRAICPVLVRRALTEVMHAA